MGTQRNSCISEFQNIHKKWRYAFCISLLWKAMVQTCN